MTETKVKLGYWKTDINDLNLDPKYHELESKELAYMIQEVWDDPTLQEYLRGLYARKLCYVQYEALPSNIIGVPIYMSATVDDFSFDVVMSGILETAMFVCKIPFQELLNADINQLNEADQQRKRRRISDEEEEIFSTIKRRKLTE